jgi:hypothetical protein
MKIKHKRNIKKEFPLMITWVEDVVLNGNVYTQGHELVVTGEEMLWRMKDEIEQKDAFLYWLTSWEILKYKFKK